MIKGVYNVNDLYTIDTQGISQLRSSTKRILNKEQWRGKQSAVEARSESELKVWICTKFRPPSNVMRVSILYTLTSVMVAALLLSTLLVITIPGAVSFAPPSSVVDGRRVASTNLATSRNSHAPSHLQASLEAILFDCDGVLADTERDGHR